MIKELRLARQTDESIKRWINDELTRGTAAFEIDLSEDVGNYIDQLNSSTGPNMSPDFIENTIRAISDKEIKKLNIDQIIHEDVISRLKPQQIKKYVDRIIDEGNQAKIDQLIQASKDVEAMSLCKKANVQTRKQIAAALRGENIPQSKSGRKRGGTP